VGTGNIIKVVLPLCDAVLSERMSRPALGLIEIKGLAGAIEAVHAATGEGEIVIASLERSESGLITVKIEGEWETVQSALQAGARAAEQAGELISMHIIPRTDSGLGPILPYGRFVARYLPDRKQPSQPSPRPTATAPSKPRPEKKERPAASEAKGEPATVPPQAAQSMRAVPEPPGEQPRLGLPDLEKMPVAKLRRYARTIKGLPIQGRQISLANRQNLLGAIKSVMKPESGRSDP